MNPDPNAPHTHHEPRLSVLNLMLGGIAFAVAAAMAGAALRLAGVQTLVGIIASIATAIAFLILWNLRIHRQPHGLFLCSSLLCLGGAAVALAHALYVGDLLSVQTKFGPQPQVITGETRATRPPPEELTSSQPPPRTVASSAPVPLSEASPPPAAKTPEWTAQWRSSQAEVMRRYPIVGVRDSRENKAFVASYQALRKSNPTYFDDPDWPMRLAQALAERDGWERGDGIIEERPVEPAAEPPLDPMQPPTDSAPALPDTPDTGSEGR